MDTVLVVCYSYSGVSSRVARLLGSHHGWPVGRIRDARPRDGGSGMLRCVLDSLLRRRPEIRYDGPDPADFGTVVLVSPFWVHRLAAPMRSFIAEHHDALQRVAVISTMGRSGHLRALAEATRLLGRPPVQAEAFTAREIEDGTGIARVVGFGDRLLPRTGPTQPAGRPTPQAPVS